MRRLAVLLVGVVAALFVAAPSFGHGDLRGTSPERGSTVRKPPERITITLTEAPSKGAEAEVIDGCKRKVPSTVAIDGNDIVVAPRGGRRGDWKVSYRAVSSVDGHQTRGKLTFSVAGRKDCSRRNDDPAEDEIDAADNPGIVENPNPPDEGGRSWLLWVGAGTILVVAAAFLVRRGS
ncbi:MAG: copper resistance protein CopC [Actinobacteria bacterium]|nr:copper resistance protein CopC [Actinomycetota bacterium]